MEENLEGDQFVQLLTSAQPQLFAYLMVLLGDFHEASNVLQEANLVLWTKKAEFTLGTNFLAWARNIAYFKAMSSVRDRGREKLIVDQSLVDHAFSRYDSVEIGSRRMALRHCMSELTDEKLDLLRMRYSKQKPVSKIAEDLGRTEAAIKMSLRRLRLALLRCIEKKMRMTL